MCFNRALWQILQFFIKQIFMYFLTPLIRTGFSMESLNYKKCKIRISYFGPGTLPIYNFLFSFQKHF